MVHILSCLRQCIAEPFFIKQKVCQDKKAISKLHLEALIFPGSILPLRNSDLFFSIFHACFFFLFSFSDGIDKSHRSVSCCLFADEGSA